MQKRPPWTSMELCWIPWISCLKALYISLSWNIPQVIWYWSYHMPTVTDHEKRGLEGGGIHVKNFPLTSIKNFAFSPLFPSHPLFITILMDWKWTHFCLSNDTLIYFLRVPWTQNLASSFAVCINRVPHCTLKPYKKSTNLNPDPTFKLQQTCETTTRPSAKQQGKFLDLQIQTHK